MSDPIILPPDDDLSETESLFREIIITKSYHVKKSFGTPGIERKTVTKTDNQLKIETDFIMAECACGKAIKTKEEIGGKCHLPKCRVDICLECVNRRCIRCSKRACADHMSKGDICDGHGFWSSVFYELVK